jgi:hypothetical protein
LRWKDHHITLSSIAEPTLRSITKQNGFFTVGSQRSAECIVRKIYASLISLTYLGAGARNVREKLYTFKLNFIPMLEMDVKSQVGRGDKK